MPLTITIQAFGEDQMARTLLRFADRATTFVPAFRQIRAAFYETEARQFETQGAQGAAGPWAPLKPSTVAYKVSKGYPPNILEATGRLKKSLTEPGGDSQYLANANSMVIRSRVPYGVYHQSTAPRRVLPRRPPVSLTEEQKIEWVKILQRYLMGVAE